MRSSVSALIVLLILYAPSLANSPPEAPPETENEYGFAELEEDTMEKLLKQGTLVIVRQKEDTTLENVTAGQLVEAPVEVIWGVITDYENYPEIMPQTEGMEIVDHYDDNNLLAEQTIGVKIWRLPTVDIKYKLAQHMEPMTRVRFWHVEGELEGTYGGWDLVPAGDRTMIFYTLHSNLTALGWGLGGIMKSQPDFMAGVNVTTAMMVAKAVKAEAERRN